MADPLPSPSNVDSTVKTAAQMSNKTGSPLIDVTDFEPKDEITEIILELIRHKMDKFQMDKPVLDYYNKVRRGKLIKNIVYWLITQVPLLMVLLVRG